MISSSSIVNHLYYVVSQEGLDLSINLLDTDGTHVLIVHPVPSVLVVHMRDR